MSPPQVNLATKNIIGDEVPPEKEDPLDFPAVVTLETERRAHHHRHADRQRRRRRIMCGAAFVILVTMAVLAILPMALKWRRHHNRKHWTCNYGKDNINENVWVDHKNQLIHAKHDHDQNLQTPAIHMLHEYKRRLVAYRDEEKNICYIDRLDETFEEGYERWEMYEKHGHKDPRILRVLSDRPVEIVVVEHIADIHILAHCHNANSFWVMEIEKTSITKEMKIVYM